MSYYEWFYSIYWIEIGKILQCAVTFYIYIVHQLFIFTNIPVEQESGKQRQMTNPLNSNKNKITE